MCDESKTNIITDILYYSSEVVDQLQKLAREFDGMIFTIRTFIHELRNASAKEKSYFREYIESLIKLAQKLFELIDAIDIVYYRWNVNSERIIYNLRENSDISDLKDWVDILQCNLSRYELKYQEYNELNKVFKC
jgi:hypothetical protein